MNQTAESLKSFLTQHKLNAKSLCVIISKGIDMERLESDINLCDDITDSQIRILQSERFLCLLRNCAASPD